MERVGVTGHVDVGADVAAWVARVLTERLGRLDPATLRGVTCLARGADQVFARVVLALDGRLDVVLPARDYRALMAGCESAPDFRDLLGRADTVHTMPFEHSGRQAYLAASQEMLDRCDRIVAVWDGEPSQRLGDTADVVRRARQRDLPVDVVWPDGAQRTGHWDAAAGPSCAVRPVADDAPGAREAGEAAETGDGDQTG